ncbi:hypothetical protein VINE108274_16510 [Vibrio neptunius]
MVNLGSHGYIDCYVYNLREGTRYELHLDARQPFCVVVMVQSRLLPITVKQSINLVIIS